jgi:hypothetical protein
MPDLDQTRQQLDQISALAARLPAFLTGTTPKADEAVRAPVAGSRPPLDVDLLDLIDGRTIDNWVRMVYETMTDVSYRKPGPAKWGDLGSECRWLAQHVEWIAGMFPDPEPVDQDRDHCALRCPDGHYLTGKRVRTVRGRQTCTMCPTGFVTDIRSLYWRYVRAARELPGPKLTCPTCGNAAFIDGEWLVCQEVQDHDRTVRDIEHEYRFAPKATATDLAARFGITVDVIYKWRSRGKLHPAGKEGRNVYFWPWDVFCLVNPTVAEAIDARDTAIAG